MRLSARERIRRALRGEEVDRVPFTVYWFMLPRGDVERRLRNAGVAILERADPFRVEMPNVRVTTHEYYDHGLLTSRQTVCTPVGEVYTTKRAETAYGSSWWTVDHYIKRPEDYRVLEFMVRDTIYRPNHDAVRLAQARLGEDGFVMGNSEYCPMHRLLYHWMGLERFSIDLYERPGDVLSLCHLSREKQREMYRVCADSPAELINYCGNVHEDVVGLKRFEEYYAPCVNEFADVLHAKNKLLSCHLDANMSTLAGAVAKLRFDVVEAFTPVPTCDMTVKEARQAWPDKVLWVNFPSSVHVEPAERIRQETIRILTEAAPGRRFLIGVTEDVPEDAWRTSFRVICDTIREHGGLPIRAG